MIRTIRAGCLVLFLIISLKCRADPAPFGFELGKANLKDIESNHKVLLKKNDNKFGGTLVWVEHKSLDLDGLKSLAFGFDKKNILQAVELIMDAQNYDAMCQVLDDKYKAVARDQYHNGKKGSLFRDGNTNITVLVGDNPAEIKIVYLTSNMSKTMDVVEGKDKTRKIQQGKAKL